MLYNAACVMYGCNGAVVYVKEAIVRIECTASASVFDDNNAGNGVCKPAASDVRRDKHSYATGSTQVLHRLPNSQSEPSIYIYMHSLTYVASERDVCAARHLFQIANNTDTQPLLWQLITKLRSQLLFPFFPPKKLAYEMGMRKFYRKVSDTQEP